MGREIKRVPMDFDWPMNKIWPPYLATMCTEEIRYAMGMSEDADIEELCEVCRRAAKWAGVSVLSHGCPEWKIQPPAGEGWQLWETVTEGSPVTPVFSTPEELASWLVKPGNDTSITRGTSYDQWLSMIKARWAPSMIRQRGVSKVGVQCVSENQTSKG